MKTFFYSSPVLLEPSFLRRWRVTCTTSGRTSWASSWAATTTRSSTLVSWHPAMKSCELALQKRLTLLASQVKANHAYSNSFSRVSVYKSILCFSFVWQVYVLNLLLHFQIHFWRFDHALFIRNGSRCQGDGKNSGNYKTSSIHC